MDSFVEQLIARRKTAADFALLFVITLGAVLSLFFVVRFLFWMTALCFLLIVGIGWLAWYAITSMNVEYEYTVTNGDIDIDQIIGKRKRKRLVSVPHTRIESLFPYSETALSGKQFDRTVMVATHKDAITWCFTYHSKKSGHTVVLFEPNERVFTALYRALPRLLQMEVEKTGATLPLIDNEE